MKLKANDNNIGLSDGNVAVKKPNPVGTFFKKHGKKFIALIVVVALAGGGFKFYQIKQAEKMLANQPKQTFQTVTKMDISNSIAVTGTIESNESRTVTTLVTDTKVLSVSVDVGDYVQAGDPICTFDTTSIKDKISRLEKKIKVAEQQAALEEQTAANSLADAQYDAVVNVSENQIDVDSAIRDYQDQERKVGEAEQDVADAQQDYEDNKSDYEKYKKKAKKLKDLIEEYYAQADDEQRKNVLSGSGYSSIDEAESKYESFCDKRDNYKDKMESAEDTISDRQSALKDAQSTLTDRLDSYNKAVNNATDSALKDQRTIREKENSATSTELSNSTKTDDSYTTLDDYYEELNDCNVVAPISGLITSISVEEGQKYKGDNSQQVCVIQDDTSYKVTGTVDQYDIASISTNMTAVVKTDATGDDELEGVVTFVSPVPKSSDSTEYEIEISLNERDSRLRLGMTAETSVLVESRKDVLAVPYDCIEDDSDGNSYIYLASGASSFDKSSSTSANMPEGFDKSKKSDVKSKKSRDSSESTETATKKVQVQKGLETDYYTEIISDAVKEGDSVLVPNSISDSSSDDSSGGMGGPFGGGGGGGPQGGGPGGGGGPM